MSDFKKFLLDSSASIRDAMRVINNGGEKTAIFADENNKLLATISDGDVRRALLNKSNMSDSAFEIANHKPKFLYENSSKKQISDYLKKNDINFLPIINSSGCISFVETSITLSKFKSKDNPVFIMAGGFGKRLKPITDSIPKPMLEINGIPLLERTIKQLSEYGFKNFYISTHYLPEKITGYFGNGRDFNVEINYIHEEIPLGTGGALGLLPKDLIDLPVLMINGDILTNMDFDDFLEYHNRNAFNATVCVREIEHQVSYGVVESSDNIITKIVEKPNYRYDVNTGIYILSSDLVRLVEKNFEIDMVSLLETFKKDGYKIGVYHTTSYWLDIGRVSDFNKAQEDIKEFFESVWELLLNSM